MLTWIRENPQLAALSFSAAVLAFLMAILAVMMMRAGTSLKPLVWFVGFVAIVAGPQAVVHLLDGFVLRQEREAQPLAQASSANGNSGVLAPVPWEKVFGPHADPALITDAKLGLKAILGEALEAKLSFSREGSSALAARFPSPDAASRALDRYGAFFAFAQAEGSDASGWTARRHAGQGEWVHLVSAGPELYAWTAAEKETVLANRARALGSASKVETRPPTPAPKAKPRLVSKRLRAQTGLMIGVVSLNLFAAGLWFFKGSAWAARIGARQTAKPVDAESLRHQLLAINQANVPTDVKRLEDGSIEVNWRYADARWFDLMRLQQLRRTQRLVLSFDESSHTVRVREYWSALDASADARQLRFDWKAASGIQFFAVEHRRVFGAQLDSNGKFTGELNQAYTFNLQELKAPIIDVVTRGGWLWQPLVWNAPATMRWLTE